MNDVSKKLKELVRLSGKTYRDLEAETGVPRSAIQRYASGNTNRIPIDRLQVISIALGTTAEHILGWDKSNQDLLERVDKASPSRKMLIEIVLNSSDEEVNRLWKIAEALQAQ